MARANPQLAELASGAECLVAFHGPQAYVTPSWYATKAETHKVVPTWNFVAVHAWGKPVIQDDPAWLRAQLEALTEPGEAASCPGAWRTRRPISSPRRCAPSWASRFPSRVSKASGKPARTAPLPIGAWRKPGGRGRRGHGGTGGAARRTGLRLHIRAWRRLGSGHFARLSRGRLRGVARRRARPGRPGCLSRPPAAARRRPRSLHGCCPACSSCARSRPGNTGAKA